MENEDNTEKWLSNFWFWLIDSNYFYSPTTETKEFSGFVARKKTFGFLRLLWILGPIIGNEMVMEHGMAFLMMYSRARFIAKMCLRNPFA